MTFDIITNVISVLSALAVPIVVLLIGNNFAKKTALEKSLHDKRVPLYNELLEPLIVLNTPDDATDKDRKYKGKSNSDIAIQIIKTTEYNKKMFEMGLIAPDSVIRAFNKFYQYFYSTDGDFDTETVMNLWGNILLEIRKSMGNNKTELHPFEMLEWKLKDISTFKKNGKYPKLDYNHVSHH